MCEVYFILVLKDGTYNKNPGNNMYCIPLNFRVHFITADGHLMCGLINPL